jgi:hypothetical protein
MPFLPATQGVAISQFLPSKLSAQRQAQLPSGTNPVIWPPFAHFLPCTKEHLSGTHLAGFATPVAEHLEAPETVKPELQVG